MSDTIDVFCSCGSKRTVYAKHAGRSYACPKCGQMMMGVAPAKKRTIDPIAEIELESEPAASQRKSPFWQDPVTIIGALVPTTIVLAFLVYVWADSSNKAFHKNLLEKFARAQKLEQSNNINDAYDLYYDISKARPGYSAEVDLAIRQSATSRRLLEDRVIEERKRIHAEKEEERRVADEVSRLMAIRASIRGDAWVETKAGTARKARGITLSLLPSKVTIGRARDYLDAVYSKAYMSTVRAFDRNEKARVGPEKEKATKLFKDIGALADAINGMRKHPDSHLISVQVLFLYSRGAFKFDPISETQNDYLWMDFVKDHRIAVAESDVDGHYVMAVPRGGSFCLYASYSTDYSLIEWIPEVNITENGDIRFDLHNDKAMIILNKSD